MNLDHIIAELPAPHSGAGYVLAYSGGLDSTVLLHLLAGRVPLRAIHVHHGLQAQADSWAAHCDAQCARLGVQFQSCRVQVSAGAQREHGLEAAARRARYAALAAQLRPGEVLLTAQHADDQAETLLLQLMRGAGPAGLAGMPRCNRFAQGQLARPLLECQRSQLLAWAQTHSLHWVEDPSNHDLKHDRSWLRQTLWPSLRQRWPGISKTLSRAASHQAETQQLLQDLAAADLPACRGPDTHSLSCSALRQLTPVRCRNLVRHWLQLQDADMPSSACLQRLQNEVLPAREDAQPILTWGHWALRRHRDALYLTAADVTVVGFACDWQPDAVLKLSGGKLQAQAVRGRGLRAAASLQVRQRQGGERILLRGMHQSVKQLLRAAAVPPWLRGSLPLLYAGEELIAVADLCIADGWRITAGNAAGWQLQWQPLQPGWPAGADKAA